MRPSTSGLARTKENFPALGGGSSSSREPFKPPNLSSNASTILFKTPTKSATNNNTSNKNGAANKAKAAAAPIKSHDFPALPGSASSSKRANLESDMIETPLSFNSSAVSAKHKVLVQAYDTSNSAANMLANQKIKTIQRVEAKPQAVQQDYVPSIKSKENFPALGGGAASSSMAPQWLNGTNGGGSKKQPQMSKKLKVAPAPILPTTKFNETSKKDEDTNKKAKSNEKLKTNNQNDKKTKEPTKAENSNGKKAEKDKAKKSDDTAKKTKENNEKNANGNKSDKKALIDSSAIEQNGGTTINGTGTNSYSSVAHFTMPPPGFPAKKNEKNANSSNTSVPPGFESLSKPSSYMSPSNALQRNQVRGFLLAWID